MTDADLLELYRELDEPPPEPAPVQAPVPAGAAPGPADDLVEDLDLAAEACEAALRAKSWTQARYVEQWQSVRRLIEAARCRALDLALIVEREGPPC
jgi:hypothetical protein